MTSLLEEVGPLPEFFGLRPLSTGGPKVANIDPRWPDAEPGDPPIVNDPDVVDPLRPNVGSIHFITNYS